MCIYLSTENVNATLKLIPKVELKKNKKAYVSFSDVKLEFTTTRWVVVLLNIHGGEKKILLKFTNSMRLIDNFIEWILNAILIIVY